VLGESVVVGGVGEVGLVEFGEAGLVAVETLSGVNEVFCSSESDDSLGVGSTKGELTAKLSNT